MGEGKAALTFGLGIIICVFTFVFKSKTFKLVFTGVSFAEAGFTVLSKNAVNAIK
jgi:hypothetical protein